MWIYVIYVCSQGIQPNSICYVFYIQFWSIGRFFISPPPQKYINEFNDLADEANFGLVMNLRGSSGIPTISKRDIGDPITHIHTYYVKCNGMNRLIIRHTPERMYPTSHSLKRKFDEQLCMIMRLRNVLTSTIPGPTISIHARVQDSGENNNPGCR